MNNYRVVDGMCILEWLTNLERLPHTGFLICAFPVKVHRAGGAWVRAVALVKDEAEDAV